MIVIGLLALPVLVGSSATAPIADRLILALSAQTTAGFSSLAPGDLDPFSKAVTMISMAVGGGLGSTAGGIKLLRLVILIRLVQLIVMKTRLPPHAVVRSDLDERGGEAVARALALAALFATIIGISWLPFLWFGYDPLNALFEVVSATATVGLSTGIVGPDLPTGLKFLLCVDMILGRLEIVAVLVFVAPRTWIGNRRATPRPDDGNETANERGDVE